MRGVHAELARIKRHAAIRWTRVAARIAQRARVICLDEFFVADIADAMILAGLLRACSAAASTLVATSNIAPRELYKDGLQRQRFLPAIELIEAHVDVLHLDGGIDYRLRQLEQAPTYLDSRAPGTAAQLRQRFAALAGGDAARRRRRSRSKDRPHRARAVGAGMAWFEFTRAVRGTAQSERLHRARAPVSHRCSSPTCPQFTRGGRGRGAPLHHAHRRALRSRRQARGVGRRAADALYQASAAIRIRARASRLRCKSQYRSSTAGDAALDRDADAPAISPAASCQRVVRGRGPCADIGMQHAAAGAALDASTAPWRACARRVGLIPRPHRDATRGTRLRDRVLGAMPNPAQMAAES